MMNCGSTEECLSCMSDDTSAPLDTVHLHHTLFYLLLCRTTAGLLSSTYLRVRHPHSAEGNSLWSGEPPAQHNLREVMIVPNLTLTAPLLSTLNFHADISLHFIFTDLCRQCTCIPQSSCGNKKAHPASMAGEIEPQRLPAVLRHAEGWKPSDSRLSPSLLPCVWAHWPVRASAQDHDSPPSLPVTPDEAFKSGEG